VTTALLGRNPEVEHLQARIGREIRDRLAAALGQAPAADMPESLLMLWTGALVYAGMGYASYAEIADRLDGSSRLILGERHYVNPRNLWFALAYAGLLLKDATPDEQQRFIAALPVPLRMVLKLLAKRALTTYQTKLYRRGAQL
jgi:hypothetical protein